MENTLSFYCAKCVHNIQVERKKSISVFHVKIFHVYNNDACTYRGLRKGYSKISPLLLRVRTGQPENSEDIKKAYKNVPSYIPIKQTWLLCI